MRTTSSSGFKPQWVDDLIDAGFALTKLFDNSKLPVSESWQHTVADPTLSASDFPGNYGVVLSDEILVIDVDPKGFSDGDDPYVRLRADLGLAPGQTFDTFTVRSRTYGNGNEGLHIYFTKPGGSLLRTHSDEYGKGIEAKSKGSQVVGPGSIHPDTGKEYVVVHGSPYQLMPAPEALLDKFSRQTRTLSAGLSDYRDDEQTRELFKAFLIAREPAVEGAGGDEWTFKTAAAGKDLGLPEVVAYEMMRDIWNPKCTPPWTEKQLAEKVANSYAYTRDNIGNLHPAAQFEGVTAEEMPQSAQDASQYQKDQEMAISLGKIDWDAEWRRNDVTGKRELVKMKDTVNNVKNYFMIPNYESYVNPFYDLIRYNKFTYDIDFMRHAPWHNSSEPHPKTWGDDDIRELRVFFSSMLKWNPGKENIVDGALSAARANEYNPVRDWLVSLKWDGKPRVDGLLANYANVEDNRYTSESSRILMIGLVARIMKPGCKLDTMTILEGPQGYGKSQFCKALAGGEDYFVDMTLDPHNKDTIINMTGKLIVELSEMTHTRRSEAEAVKSFLTRGKDVIRLPYNKTNSTIYRQNIFIGTVNPGATGTYLSDPTGNRRFMPNKVTKPIDVSLVKRDREQLFAEAYTRFLRGEAYWITDPELMAMAQAEQEARTDKDDWAQAISTWIARELKEGRFYKKLTTVEVAQDVLNIPLARINALATRRIATAMTQLGWEPYRTRLKGVQLRGYKNPEYEKQMDDVLRGI